jgi:hypothetical protein
VAARTEVGEDTHRVSIGRGDNGLHTRARTRVAEVLAFIGLVAALIGALGPAERVRSTYSWPPKTLPEGTPSRLWYSPLLLAARIPESVAATVPCSTSRPLPDAADPVTVLATARSPERIGGLYMTRDDGRLTFGVGVEILARVAQPPMSEPGCTYRLNVADRRWSIEGGPNQVDVRGDLGQMPVVNGLFSGLDLRSGETPSIDITTRVHESRTIPRQKVAWTIAAICLFAALILVAFERRPRPRATSARLARRVKAHVHPADACIAVVLLGWWVLSPAFWDDGWTVARQGAYSTSGGFSNYYDSFGASLPLGYWLEWAQHWLTQYTTMVLAYRMPALLCLAATWIVCRWILARIASPGGQSSVVLWTFAASFAVGAMAWGMTLRQEPVVALLVAGAMACTIRFVESKTIAPLAIGAALVPLAVTAHPAGIVSIAPLLIVAPQVIRWARSRPAPAATILASTMALALVLAFIGSDVTQRRTDALTVRGYSTTVVDWRDETTRYDLLSRSGSSRIDGYGTPVRRASVALILLALLAFFLRPRVRDRTLLDLPAASLGVALLLLIATPSKWPWHFGALIGLAALAVAAETTRFRAVGARSSSWNARPFFAIGAVILALAWSWLPNSRSWNALDLRTMDWPVPSMTLVIVLPFVVLVGVFVLLTRRNTERRDQAPWRIAYWTLPVLAIVLILFPAVVLVADTARTSSWTLTRQNLDAIKGNVACGLADDLLVPVRGSARPVSTVGAVEARSTPAWVPDAPVANLPRFALGPTRDESSPSPWFELPERRVGLFVAGLQGSTETLALEWGRLGPRGVDEVGTTRIVLPAAPEFSTINPWRFLAAAELPPRKPRADAVRIELPGAAAYGAAVAVTAPVVYRSEPLRTRIEGDKARSLVFPNLRMYFPCVHLPRLNGGIVDVPGSIVVTSDATSPIRWPGSSPFAGILNLYPVKRLPVADSDNPPVDLVAFEVERRIPGAELAPPIAATSRS